MKSITQQPGVSPKHAQLRREPEGYVLRDLKSAAGTFVEGRLLQRKHLLKHGEHMYLGETELRFYDPREVEHP